MMHLEGGSGTAMGGVRRGMAGDPACGLCWEEDCGGCALLSPSMGVCPLCGREVARGSFHGWYWRRPCHWECLDAAEDEAAEGNRRRRTGRGDGE